MYLNIATPSEILEIDNLNKDLERVSGSTEFNSNAKVALNDIRVINVKKLDFGHINQHCPLSNFEAKLGSFLEGQFLIKTEITMEEK